MREKLTKQKKKSHFWQKYLPGIITGGADNDPSGIATYTIAAAKHGLVLGWLMVLAVPLLVAVQATCARIGDVTKQGLTKLLMQRFPKSVVWVLVTGLVVSILFTAGADILAMADAASLLFAGTTGLWTVLITVFLWVIILFVPYTRLAKFFGVMSLFFLAYVGAALLSVPNWGQALRDVLLPHVSHMDKDYLLAAVAMLGTTITPYLFFWEVTEQREEHASVRNADGEDMKNLPGFIFSQGITIFILLASGSTLFLHGISVNSFTDAAKALEPIAGSFSSTLFSIGILGSGFLAVPVLVATIGYVLSDVMGIRRQSLSDTPAQAPMFYGIASLALLTGGVMKLVDADIVKSLYFSQIIFGVLAPILLIFILIIANDTNVMKNKTNKWYENVGLVFTIVLMLVFSVLMFVVG